LPNFSLTSNGTQSSFLNVFKKKKNYEIKFLTVYCGIKMISLCTFLPEQASLESGLRVSSGSRSGGELRTQRAHPEALDREYVQERNKPIFSVVSLNLAARKMAGLRDGMKTYLIPFHIQWSGVV